MSEFLSKEKKIAIIGLGYVGLPLLIAMEEYFSMAGFDISSDKVQQLNDGIDATLEVGDERIAKSTSLFTDDPKELKQCDFLIVAVPTPIDAAKNPNLGPVIGATNLIAQNLKKGATIVFESTVYPGVTEEVCKPIFEKSGYVHGVDFHLGYSPERINPGDKEHGVTDILKIVSGDSEESLRLISAIYGKVITAGIYEASSIKVAEAAKVIENTQRDVNIALMNELAILFDKLGIDTRSVLEAAGTKWNFIKMTPGLVGGHCIGVDPYYLTHKAEEVGYHPQIILAGRRLNDGMSKYVAEQTIKQVIQKGFKVKNAKVLVLGVTFKEDCPDTRNSKIRDLIEELQSYSCKVTAIDPYVDNNDIQSQLNTEPFDKEDKFDAIVFGVSHKQFLDAQKIQKYFNPEGAVFIDIKSAFPLGTFAQNVAHWRL
ncbi:MAG: nucleotide sugar dehydrogenase [Candidatus Cloacimonetes bacterium]|nr:nucleotide sugar dehydrogenase [Candidatus Cloacimonadota bacterium]